MAADKAKNRYRSPTPRVASGSSLPGAAAASQGDPVEELIRLGEALMPHIDGLSAQAMNKSGSQQSSANDAVRKAVGRAIYQWNGVLDGREGTLDKRAPDTRGGQPEILYLRGFVEGAFERTQTREITQRPAEELDSAYNVPAGAAEAITDNAAFAAPSQDLSGVGIEAGLADEPIDDDLYDDAPQTYAMDEDEAQIQQWEASADIDDYYDETGGDLEEDDDLVLPGAILPPVNAPPARPARHLAPLPGKFFARALPGIRLPEGTDCYTITEDWQPKQRNALLSRKEVVAWVRSERQDTPASIQELTAAIEALGAEELPGQTPLRVEQPRVRDDGYTPSSIAIKGTPAQIKHLTSIGTWVTPWVCLQIFPNRRILPRLVCTFESMNISLRGFRKISKMLKCALRASVEVCEFLVALGIDLEALLETLELEYVRMREDGCEVHLWNVLMAPPTDDLVKLGEWRGLVASLRPRSFSCGQLHGGAWSFKCKTCGCIRHPSEMCPTISAPGWLGFIPQFCAPAARHDRASHHANSYGGRDRASNSKRAGPLSKSWKKHTRIRDAARLNQHAKKNKRSPRD